jgi:hypothetical protein
MAATWVQQKVYSLGATAVDTINTNANLSSNVTSGNLLIVGVNWTHDGTPVATCTIDDMTGGQDVWQPMGGVTAITGQVVQAAHFYRVATATEACRPRATFDAAHATWGTILAYEFSGLDPTSPYLTSSYKQQVDPGTAANAIQTNLTGTLSSSPALIYGACITLNYWAGTLVAESTLSDGTTTQTDLGNEMDIWARVSATTSVYARWHDSTHGAGNKYANFVAAFTEAAAAPTITPLASFYARMRTND